ncbi:hypothetical protein SAMN05444354_106187 [Stigmatella aurantiaca]|uniref:HTTM-like domain-containing protein n=1 Tax=Stigmatella aurantiaca TaxID=41 RepID=A0A1H7QL45_STIAU|nr:hypothetical protein [Stigmatella aurantiaca]SEL48682.1 hypothetical protein SAMN05444354_106187 [Stigmatella aurantiaca]
MTLRHTFSQVLGQRLASFALAPSSPHPLGAFRIGVALILLAQTWMLSDGVLALFGSKGLIQWAISEPMSAPWLPRIGTLAPVVQRFGLSPDECVYGVGVLYVLSLVGLLLGWRTRLSAFVAWLTHTTLINSGGMFAYGVEIFAHISLAYCVLMPVGSAFSLDVKAGRESDAPSPLATLALRVLQLHLCLVYLSTGVEKALGPQWQDGEALWKALMQPLYGQFDFAWMASVPLLTKLVTWSTLVIEIGYPLCVWPRQTRLLWVALTLGLHLGIGLFMGLWLFSGIMAVLTFTVFGFAPLYQAWLALREDLARSKPAIIA